MIKLIKINKAERYTHTVNKVTIICDAWEKFRTRWVIKKYLFSIRIHYLFYFNEPAFYVF